MNVPDLNTKEGLFEANRRVANSLPELLEALIWIAKNGSGQSKTVALKALKKAAGP